MLAGGLLTLRFMAYRIPLSYQLDYEEGNILNAAVRILHGQSIYPPPSDSLYVFNPYGPVFCGLVALIAKYFGAEFTYLRLPIRVLCATSTRYWLRSCYKWS